MLRLFSSLFVLVIGIYLINRYANVDDTLGIMLMGLVMAGSLINAGHALYQLRRGEPETE